MSKCRYDLSADCNSNDCVSCVLNKIRAEILDCLKALDDVEKFNIYLPNELSGRRLTYKQCLGFIDKYKVESEKNE